MYSSRYDFITQHRKLDVDRQPHTVDPPVFSLHAVQTAPELWPIPSNAFAILSFVSFDGKGGEMLPRPSQFFRIITVRNQLADAFDDKLPVSTICNTKARIRGAQNFRLRFF
jgi:hypothetical protein